MRKEGFFHLMNAHFMNTFFFVPVRVLMVNIVYATRKTSTGKKKTRVGEHIPLGTKEILVK